MSFNSDILLTTLVTCFEGGSFWLTSATPNPDIAIPERPWYAQGDVLRHPDFFFTLKDDQGDSHKLNVENFSKGWDILCRVYPTRAERIAEDDGSADADDYDVFLQTVIYGQVIYG